MIAPLQADLLGGWLMSEGRPNIQEERNKGGIETERESQPLFSQVEFGHGKLIVKMREE